MKNILRKLLSQHPTEEVTHTADLPPYPGRPRWVKLSEIIAIIIILLVVIMLVIGGDHGPGRHISSSGLDSHTLLGGAH